jgi:hypothetical protein
VLIKDRILARRQADTSGTKEAVNMHAGEWVLCQILQRTLTDINASGIDARSHIHTDIAGKHKQGLKSILDLNRYFVLLSYHRERHSWQVLMLFYR